MSDSNKPIGTYRISVYDSRAFPYLVERRDPSGWTPIDSAATRELARKVVDHDMAQRTRAAEVGHVVEYVGP